MYLRCLKQFRALPGPGSLIFNFISLELPEIETFPSATGDQQSNQSNQSTEKKRAILMARRWDGATEGNEQDHHFVWFLFKNGSEVQKQRIATFNMYVIRRIVRGPRKWAWHRKSYCLDGKKKTWLYWNSNQSCHFQLDKKGPSISNFKNTEWRAKKVCPWGDPYHS